MSDDCERELLGVWLSRLMFGFMVGMPENRSYEEWLTALQAEPALPALLVPPEDETR